MEDNPFAAGDPGDANRTKNDGDLLEPVAMDPSAILGRCWEIFTGNIGTVLGAILLPLIPNFAFQGVQTALQMMSDSASDDNSRVGFAAGAMAVAVVGGLVNLFFQLGSFRIFTRLARGLPADVSMLVGEGHHFLSGLGASILIGIAVLLGFLMLIVPGIVLLLGLQFSLYALIDQDLDPIAAMQESWRLTEGYKVTVFLVNLVIFILAGLFACVTLGIGYLVAIPVLALSQAVMYHSLVHIKQHPELNV